MPLLTKTIRVLVEEEKQKKIVAFELMQKMPVPSLNYLGLQVIDDDGVSRKFWLLRLNRRLRRIFANGLWKSD